MPVKSNGGEFNPARFLQMAHDRREQMRDSSVSSSRPKELRPLSVNEALPYTPLTSIVPLDSSVVSFPSGDLRTSQPLLQQKDDKAARQHLKNLDKSIVDGKGQSAAADQALATLQKALSSERITPFVFKQSVGKKTSKDTNGPSSKEALKRLGTFANMVLDSSKVRFRYQSPDPVMVPVQAKIKEPDPFANVGSVTPGEIMRNKNAYGHNSEISIGPGGTIAPQELATIQLEDILPQKLDSISPQPAHAVAPLKVDPNSGRGFSKGSLPKKADAKGSSPTEMKVKIEKDGKDGKEVKKKESKIADKEAKKPQVPKKAEVKVHPAEAKSTHSISVEVKPETPRFTEILPEGPSSDGTIQAKSPEKSQTTVIAQQQTTEKSEDLVEKKQQQLTEPAKDPVRIVVQGPTAPLKDPAKQQKQAERPNKPKLKRKHDQIDDVEGHDQRAVATGALQLLLDNLSDIFEAEDNLETNDMRGAESHFVPVDGENGTTLTLAPAVQMKLDSQLHKVISHGRFKDVPLDHILHVHKLCDNALMHAESVDIQIQSGWGEDETSAWLDRIEIVDNAGRSARTALRMMTGGRAEKQVYSEELLQRIIGLLTKMTDTGIVPMIEARSTDSDQTIFQITSWNKKVMSQLLHTAGRIMSLFTDLLAKEELAESAVTAVEFFVIRLLFVENAQNEKDSVLGITKFETFRRSAMNIIATIFSRYPDQRQFIINEVLSSLQKLPTQKARARQYKFGEGKRLQLVSVLLVRLVQTSGIRTTTGSQSSGKRVLPVLNKDDESGSEADDDDEKEEEESEDEEAEEEAGANGTISVPKPLMANAKKLYDAAGSSAQQIVKFLVVRASTSTKSGDEPHRHLLDMFVEDLITVFSLPEWPAAELLLRALVSNMIEILNDNKRPVPAKNMALEVLGVMASAILDVTASARKIARHLENGESSLSELLTQYMEDHSDGHLEMAQLASWTGPFRIVLEYLHENSPDVQSLSAQGYFTTQWTKFVLWGAKSTNEDPENNLVKSKDRSTALTLTKILYNGKWSSTEDFEPISSEQCRLAYLLTLLNVGFCKAFGHITNALVQSCSSDQARIKTRSLKSVTQMVEKDPLILDRLPQVKNLMFKCINDASSQVRDNTLALISEVITVKPHLELEFLKSIHACADDNSPSLRRRAIKTLKDIYLRNASKESRESRDVRVYVAETILGRVEDGDEGTCDLARQTLEEILLTPFWSMCKNDDLSLQSKVNIKEHISLMVLVIERNEKVSSILESFLKYAMTSEKCKGRDINIKVCTAFVSSGFEGVIDPSEIPGSPGQSSVLQFLAVFARANPKSFSQQQVAYLQPYIVDLKSADDLNLFRWSVIILRCVLPTLPAVQKDFLAKVQTDLLRNVTKLAKAELNEVSACLWQINSSLHNIDRLVNVEISVLIKLHKMESTKFAQGNDSPEIKTIQRLILLAGYFGRHCDFQSQAETFKNKVHWLKGELVAAKIVSAIKPYAAKSQPSNLRATALESVGMICQAWPRNFNEKDIVNIFQEVLRGVNPSLQKIVLASFRDFFATQDQQFTVTAMSDERDPLRGGKIGGSMTASDNDGAAALIAQGFLSDVLKIALSSLDDYALTATEVVASITRQGLVHPKECGPALVALETSTNIRIAEVALVQHQSLHQQHESMFEREYIRAIFEAFKYQRNIVKDTKGYTRVDGQIRAKLHSMYEVVKTSKSKYQAKFITGYCGKINFDVTKEEIFDQLSGHLPYSRFLIENLAFFDFGRSEDVMHAISSMESIVSNTGSSLAHLINTEVFKVTLDPETGASANMPEREGVAVYDIDQARLNKLTLASMILSMLWEARTYIRQLYNISTKDNNHRGRGRPPKESTNKNLTKSNFVSGERVVGSIEHISHALDSREESLAQCKKFAELLSIDSEVKVTGDGDEEDMATGGGRNRTPVSGEDEDATVFASGGSRHAKRKGSTSLAGTPMKKKQQRSKSSGSKSKGNADEYNSIEFAAGEWN